MSDFARAMCKKFDRLETSSRLSAEELTSFKQQPFQSSLASPFSLKVGPSPRARKISLEEFCAEYNMDDEDYRRLLILQYQPRDEGIKELQSEQAGFPPLAWEQFLAKHNQFVSRIRNPVM
ncbi:hypothetical protein EV421DRAFT_1913276 [Armillaria borealis]|uniref:Uncharacterized protein n=1 Tax=Armillaria borealis TaxID=47425 RepID=A0AA39MCV6_9AGAR|nr:hypothetical protein EV421DRAFT_1913276 [Armillaria borealis]